MNPGEQNRTCGNRTFQQQNPPVFPYSNTFFQSELRNLKEIFGFEDSLTMTAGSGLAAVGENQKDPL